MRRSRAERGHRSIGLLAGALLVLGVPATPALADDVTCSYDAPTRTVSVGVTPADNSPPIVLAFGGTILVHDDDVGDTTCAGVTEADTVVIDNASSSQPLVTGIYIGVRDPFAPGATDESGSSDEIELEVNLGPGGPVGVTSVYQVPGPEPPRSDIVLGANRINLNADEVDGVDADVTMNGVSEARIDAGSSDDRIVGAGGFGTPQEPSTVPINTCYGAELHAGNDFIVGGRRSDTLCGGQGADTIEGGAGDDTIHGEDFRSTEGGGPDRISGGKGNDMILGAKGGDRISAGAGRDRVGAAAGRDRIRLGAGRDLARSGKASDRLKGGRGMDKLIGHRGRDRVIGGRGKDLLSGGKRRDKLNGGPSFDRCLGGRGPDLFSSCERLIE